MMTNVIYNQNGTSTLVEFRNTYDEDALKGVLGCEKPVRLMTNKPGVCVVTSEEAYFDKKASLNRRVLAEYGQTVFGNAFIVDLWRLI